MRTKISTVLIIIISFLFTTCSQVKNEKYWKNLEQYLTDFHRIATDDLAGNHFF